jgi:Fe-S cluster assembly ATP-binding protein
LGFEIMLKIKNLKLKKDNKEILKGIDLEIKKGEVQALLGPNASGKSTFVQVIAGNPKFKSVKGEIFFNGKEISKLSPEKRVKMGLVLSWQNPPAIKGVKFSNFLKKISKVPFFHPKLSKNIVIKKQSVISSVIPAKAGIQNLNSFLSAWIPDQVGNDNLNFLNREINVDFSGGEKKISELLQILSLKPKMVIFDEIDSGLDLKKVETVAKIIKKELVDKKVSVLIITHSGEILKFLKPKKVNIMIAGKIVCQGKDYRQVLKTIKKYGYEKCKKHLQAGLCANR